ncbi:NAD(P)H-dependent oxidoreductase [Aureispira anguillae]|uniref:NAD(P)H-dependent oxidoreductase n=1 Tax=Aureispira anguillae TaxID=2864201 RepID=A0A915VKB9_9BACT|nr:NAD(P)H-dependent oxidoreductase [Aureispira anguillae]BDS09622.1 NAD(P)H-dependent oxidoreductase [Aureispira anguillae]
MNVLIINGNPRGESYTDALCNAYKTGALKANAQVKMIQLRALDFDLNLTRDFQEGKDLEEDLKEAIEYLKWCDHIVWVHPLWWASIPALMKGFIDRAFLSGVTYRYEKGKALPEQLLKGKTARIICTSDSPKWYYKFYLGSPATKQLKKGTLEFCGVRPVRTSYIAPIRNSTENFRKKWLDKVTSLGQQLI